MPPAARRSPSIAWSSTTSGGPSRLRTTSTTCSWQVAADGTGTREPRLLLAATGERTIGRSREVALERTWGGADPLGRPRPVVDLTFASTTGQTMIRDAAVELAGRSAGGEQRIGLVAGLAGVGIALLVVTVVVTLALTGGF